MREVFHFLSYYKASGESSVYCSSSPWIMQNMTTKSCLILALALFCQVKAQFSASFGGSVPGGRPGPHEAGLETGLHYDVPFGSEHEGYGPDGHLGYGGPNDSPVGPQGGYDRPIPPGWAGGYYPGDSYQGGSGGYYQGGRPFFGFGRPGRRPGFRPPGRPGNYNPVDGLQGGYYVGGRPMAGFGRPGRRPGYRPPAGTGWSNGYYPGNNIQGGYGGYFPVDRPQDGYFGSGTFHPIGKPQIENNKPVAEEKPTQDETTNQAEEKPPQIDLQEGAEPGAETDELPVFQGNTEVGSTVNVNAEQP